MSFRRISARQWFIIIFALALIIRMAFALSLPADDNVFADESYERYATHFANGDGFGMDNPYKGVGPERVHAFRPPLFPFLWGCVYKLTNGTYAPIRAAHALLGALTCILAMLVAKELVPKRRVVIWTGLLCALYPPLVWHSVHLMTEPLFIFLSILSLYALIRMARTHRWRWLILAGMAAGLGTLSRSMMTGFLPLMAFWVWWISGISWKGLGRAAAFTAVVTLVMLPWIVRNAFVFGEFLPTTTDAGHGAYVANNPEVLATPENTARGFVIPESWEGLVDENDSELECQRKLLQKARDYLRSNPRAAVELIARRFITFWRFYPNPTYISRKHVLIYACSYIPVFLLMLPGAWLVGRRYAGRSKGSFALIVAWVAYTCGIHALILAMMRYRVPLMPLLLILAATTLCALQDRMKQH
jgi:4-amino-4-deoxy-L-arabinose transferase-like glycosyltransferase